jgi:hypothetical protein
MRCILGFCVVLSVSVPVWAQNNVPGQEPFAQQSAVSTPVPNIHASGAGTVTTAQPGVQQNMVAGQPAATTTVPAGNMTYYYYYPATNSGRMFRTTSPMTFYSANSGPVYTAPTQYYYTTARRGPFGLFRRRFVQPAYTTTSYTPTYSTSPGYYYYTPTTYVVPAPASTGMNTTGAVAPNTVTGAGSPVYTPTTYNVPTEPVPADTTIPSGTTVPSRTIPAPPSVNPR